jgi:hypothetical protein
MGFLNHSTNNIVLDAVLTDYGRKALSNNDGSFSVVKFALSDEEVNYNIIEKYGRNVGKEKIEKNTPVFEALTTNSLSQKNTLIGTQTHLTHFPKISIEANTSTYDSSVNTVTLATDISSLAINIEQSWLAEGSIPIELRNSEFIVTVNNTFLELKGNDIDTLSTDAIATYRVSASSSESNTSAGGRASFTIKRRANLSASTFSTYGVDSIIRTYVTVEGQQDGSSHQFEVIINK